MPSHSSAPSIRLFSIDIMVMQEYLQSVIEKILLLESISTMILRDIPATIISKWSLFGMFRRSPHGRVSCFFAATSTINYPPTSLAELSTTALNDNPTSHNRAHKWSQFGSLRACSAAVSSGILKILIPVYSISGN